MPSASPGTGELDAKYGACVVAAGLLTRFLFFGLQFLGFWSVLVFVGVCTGLGRLVLDEENQNFGWVCMEGLCREKSAWCIYL